VLRDLLLCYCTITGMNYLKINIKVQRRCFLEEAFTIKFRLPHGVLIRNFSHKTCLRPSVSFEDYYILL